MSEKYDKRAISKSSISTIFINWQYLILRYRSALIRCMENPSKPCIFWSVGGAFFVNITLVMLMCQLQLYCNKDVATCFVLEANRSLVGILHNNRWRHGTTTYRAFSRDVIAAMLVSHEQKISHFIYNIHIYVPNKVVCVVLFVVA
jgi:hypothetical protein